MVNGDCDDLAIKLAVGKVALIIDIIHYRQDLIDKHLYLTLSIQIVLTISFS